MKYQNLSVGLLGIALLALANSASAATILGSTADSGITNTPALRPTANADELVKAGNNAGAARNVVLVFQLPTLTLGQTFDTASLSFTLLQNGATVVTGGSSFVGSSTTPTFNIDLYGLGRRTTSTVATGDLYFGATADATDASLLQADFITSSTAVGTRSFSGSTLVSYLNTQYAAGVGAGQYVFIRLNPDANAGSESTNNMNYRVSMADDTSSSYSHITPQITYTVIPEPASAALLGLGLLTLVRRRR